MDHAGFWKLAALPPVREKPPRRLRKLKKFKEMRSLQGGWQGERRDWTERRQNRLGSNREPQYWWCDRISTSAEDTVRTSERTIRCHSIAKTRHGRQTDKSPPYGNSNEECERPTRTLEKMAPTNDGRRNGNPNAKCVDQTNNSATDHG